MNILKKASEAAYTADETTRKYQELSWTTFLGFNVLSLNAGIIFCLSRELGSKEYFHNFANAQRSKIMFRHGETSFTTHAIKVLSDDQMAKFEGKFIRSLLDIKGLMYDDNRGDFIFKFKDYMKEYYDALEQEGKKRYGNDFIAHTKSYYIRYCALNYALYKIDRNLFMKAKSHSDIEMNYFSTNMKKDYLKQAKNDIKELPMAESEIELIKDANYTRNFECRYISYEDERFATNVLHDMIVKENEEQENLVK